MSEETKTYVFGNEGDKNGLGSGLLSGMLGGALANGFGFGNLGMLGGLGGFGGFGNWGMNGIADLFGLAIIASMFGWNNGNGFGLNGNGNAAAGFLSNQLNNDSGRELIMNAVTAQGDATRTAVQNLANALGQDFDLVNSGVQNVQNALNAMAVQQAVSVPQIINALQMGNASLSQQFCQCCCDQKLLTTQQGYESQIRTIEQTNHLGSQADRNTASIVGAINNLHTDMTREFCNVKEREMQSKIDTQSDIITQLRGQLDNDRQTAQLYAAITPLQAKVNEIAAKQPNTVPVQYPNLVAVNNTPYNGGFNNFGNGWNNGLFF